MCLQRIMVGCHYFVNFENQCLLKVLPQIKDISKKTEKKKKTNMSVSSFVFWPLMHPLLWKHVKYKKLMALIFSTSKRVRKQDNKARNVKNLFSLESVPNKSSWHRKLRLGAPALWLCGHFIMKPGQDDRYLSSNAKKFCWWVSHHRHSVGTKALGTENSKWCPWCLNHQEQMYIRIRESGWKRPSGSTSPTNNLTYHVPFLSATSARL